MSDILSYEDVRRQYRAKFSKKEWERERRKRAKLKSLVCLDFSFGALYFGKIVNDKTNYFLKPYNYPAAQQILNNSEAVRNFRMINEFLIPILCRQIGLEAATYKAVIGLNPDKQFLKNANLNFQFSDALLSKNFLSDDEFFYNPGIYDFSGLGKYNFMEFKHLIKNTHKEDPTLEVDLDDMCDKMLRLIILDLLTLQTDRHEANLPIVINNENNSLKFSCVFDNEFAFCCANLKDYQLASDPFNILTERKNINIENYIKVYDGMQKNNFRYMWTITPNCEKNYHACLKDIVEYANTSPQAKEVLCDVLSKIDVEKAFERMDDYGVICSSKFKELVGGIIEYGKNEFTRELIRNSELAEKLEVEQKEKLK